MAARSCYRESTREKDILFIILYGWQGSPCPFSCSSLGFSDVSVVTQGMIFFRFSA